MAWKRSAAVAALTVGIGCTAAHATDGYFMNGYGASQTALAGAGAAYSQDAMAIALNPAGLTHVDNQTVAGMAIFMPFRSYEAGGAGALSAASQDSHNNWFPVPNLAYTKPLSRDTVLGIGMYGNGGMNTRYSGNVFTPSLPSTLTGVDLNQAFLSASLSKRFGNLSIGVAPTMAMQLFRANGLQGFDNAGYSANPGSVTDRGYSFSYGGGVRAGIEYDVTPALRVGVAGSTKMYMTAFDQYKGLFAGGGNFDIPASITAGVAYDVRPSVTVMFDYKHIFYSDVPAIANPSTNQQPFGSDNGPGFGWSDINVYKFAAEWRASPVWTFRAGYSYNDSPLNTRDMMFNILAPATVQHHITGGFKYRWSENMDVEFSGMYAPEASFSGATPNVDCNNTGFCGQPVEVKMHQLVTMMGIVYHWNGRRELEPLK